MRNSYQGTFTGSGDKGVVVFEELFLSLLQNPEFQYHSLKLQSPLCLSKIDVSQRTNSF